MTPLTADLGHSGKVLDTVGNVLLFGLFRQVEHVRAAGCQPDALDVVHHLREQWLSVLFEVSLVGLEHTVKPWEELLGTVIRVENDGTGPSATTKVSTRHPKLTCRKMEQWLG